MATPEKEQIICFANPPSTDDPAKRIPKITQNAADKWKNLFIKTSLNIRDEKEYTCNVDKVKNYLHIKEIKFLG